MSTLGMQKEIVGLTVILSTFNRSADLYRTLEAFCALKREGLDVEFVVVDNNSSDDTPEVIDAFLGRLPLRHLKESNPGKNCALNHALDTISLKEIVVFTDDDVTPALDWLSQIASSCNRWPEHAVFGGRILVHWPDENGPPNWCDKWLWPVMFAWHDYGDEERPYLSIGLPLGPNFWVRSKVFAGNYRYDENLGPRPTNRLMGSETSFLIELSNRGFPPIHVPKAIIHHRIQASEINQRAILRRAFRFGKSKPHLDRLKSSEVMKVNIPAQFVETLHAIASLVISCLPGNPAKRFASRYSGIVRLGTAKESLLFVANDISKAISYRISKPNVPGK